MIQRIALSLTLLLMHTAASGAGIVARAQTSELRTAGGKVVNRVEQDQNGHVIRLVLNDLQLSQEEIQELGELEHLRQLILFRTNLRDPDLKHLSRCRNLESLNLTGTEVTDNAVDSLLKFEKLKYLCLGDVNISPEAIAQLKSHVHARGQDLKLGYFQKRR